MFDYFTLKAIHVTAAALSIVGFTVRYGWMIADSPLRSLRAVKVVPHIVDTVLLASAIALAARLGVAPWNAGWLGYKTIALFVYVGLGMVALRFGHTRGGRITAGALAILVFASIVWVARYKSLPGISL
ncbi:MAG: SirB2 family protein [Gammaproteobacteria bacterium]